MNDKPTPSRDSGNANDRLAVSAVEKSGLVCVPGGIFSMGSAPGEGHENERPTHQVFVEDFFIGRFPVTFSEYDVFCAATGCSYPDDYGEGRGSRPVIFVDWFDAVAHCNWRSIAEGLGTCYIIRDRDVQCDFNADGYRLPTEAEWEKAARGTDGRAFPWGNEDPSLDHCNFGGHSGFTTPVGSYSPKGDSPFGCSDMAGNVGEWCWDWFDEDYFSRSPENNPTGPEMGQFRVIRGGSWLSKKAQHLRTTSRNRDVPSPGCSIFGFRIARRARK